jgi:hypothetical protein
MCHQEAKTVVVWYNNDPISHELFEKPHVFNINYVKVGKLKCWMKNQHLTLQRSPCNTQRQAPELISGPDLAIGAQLLSFNRTQSRAVIGLLAAHNTLRRHLHVMGLSDNPTCRKCGAKEETSMHIL